MKKLKKPLIVLVICTVFLFAFNVNGVGKTNLLPEDDSTFENGLSNTLWYSFGGAGFTIGDGATGEGIKMNYIPNSWSSPTIDLSQFINEPGVYSVGLAIKAETKNDTVNMSLLIRGNKRNSFIIQHGNNFYYNLGSVKTKSDTWTYISDEFEVTQDDIDRKGKWELCLASVPDDVTAVYMDNAELIKGKDEELTGISAIFKTEENGDIKAVFDESVKETFFWALATSLGIALFVTAFKINNKEEVTK